MFKAYPVPFFFLISIEKWWWILSLVNKGERYNLSVSDTGGLGRHHPSTVFPTGVEPVTYSWLLYCRCSTTELQETRSKLVGAKDTKLGSCDKCSTTVRSTRIFPPSRLCHWIKIILLFNILCYTITLDIRFSSLIFVKKQFYFTRC